MKKLLIISILAAMPVFIAGQTGKTPAIKKTAATPATPVISAPAPTPEPEVMHPFATPAPGKKNGRPVETKVEPVKDYTPVYVYTFVRPGFTYSDLRIEHDEDGRGRIWFKQDGADESLDDPLQVSKGTMELLRKTFDEMNFLDSTEDYQFPGRDFSNMGNLTITLDRAGKKRTVKYNWTQDKDAKLLMDTYRAISNEATFKFEIESARTNQPLLTPGIVDALDGYISRGEINDPPHLVPYLTQLSQDERLPLIARNHLTRLIAQITKTKH